MRIAVVDIGANTMRLLVADANGDGIATVRQERTHLALGEEVEELGALTPRAIERAAHALEKHLRHARKLQCDRIVVLVTSPGRQSANARALVVALERAGGVPASVLSADEEAQLAFDGALAGMDASEATVAVCDVGGGSVQIAVGTRASGVAWSRSLDIGSLRLTSRFFSADPPSAGELAAAVAAVAHQFAPTSPPLPQSALATGGTARALRSLFGDELDERVLRNAIDLLAAEPSRTIARRHDLDRGRARTLLAGAIVLAEAQRRLNAPLRVARGGVREGAVLAAVAEAAAASA